MALNSSPPVTSVFADAVGSRPCFRVVAVDDFSSWNEVLAACDEEPFFASDVYLAYQRLVLEENKTLLAALPLILLHDRRPVGVWPLTLEKDAQGETQVRSFGQPVHAPVLVGSLPEGSRKSLMDSCFELLEEISRKLGIKSWVTHSVLRNEGLSVWHRKLQEHSGTVSGVSTELCADLGLSQDALWLSIRKSFRPLITKGQRLWKISVLDGHEGAELMPAVAEFHVQVAGRKTRPDGTWTIQQKAVADKRAFLVVLRSEEGRMIGVGVFHHTRTESIYSVGIYDRDLFHLPLGHVVQAEAIKYLKEAAHLASCRWHVLGIRHYPGAAPDPKELSISQFKEGFATHFFPKLTFQTPVNPQAEG